MKKLLLIGLSFILLIIGNLYATDIQGYVSPGIQIGINTSGNLFYSYQVTFGLVNLNTEKDEYRNDSAYLGIPISCGFTFGKRKFMKPNKKSYNYIDVQISSWFIGLGFGHIIDDVEKINKFKLWCLGGTFFGFFSYDYINFEDYGKHHFGYFGLVPFIISDSDG